MNTKLLLIFFFLIPHTQCASEHAQTDRLTEIRRIVLFKETLYTAIKNDNMAEFKQILNAHPDLVCNGPTHALRSDINLLSQFFRSEPYYLTPLELTPLSLCLKCDSSSNRTNYISELLSRGAPLHAYALAHHARLVCEGICENFHDECMRRLIANLERFYNTIESAQLPEELKSTDTIFGAITTPQQYLQAHVLQFINSNIWHCSFCEKPWTKHKKKPNLEYLALLAAAVKLPKETI